MKPHSKKGLYYSALLHGAVFLVLAAGALLSTLLKQPEPHVFHLKAPPLTAQKGTLPTSASEPALPIPIDLPAIESARPLPKPSPPAPKKTVERVRQSEPAAKPMSHDQFVKKFSPPKPTKTQPRPRKKPPPDIPAIDTSGIRKELSRNLSTNISKAESSEVSEAEQNQLMAFQDKIYALLDETWKKPKNLSGTNYGATVRFVVTAEGRIHFQEFLQSSGNEIFDASVRAAFTDAGPAEPPPWGKPVQMVLTFRLTE